MLKGIIKWFNKSKGYGFIVQEGGNDIFFHRSDLDRSLYNVLKDGDAVMYEVGEGRKGEKAVNVKLG
jgi:CspA family cold shock protein